MNVLILCEKSQRIQKAFERKGAFALSCDILPAEIDPSRHLQDDAIAVLTKIFYRATLFTQTNDPVEEFYPDLIIAHPPCTYLSSAGARWWKYKKREQKQAIQFFAYIYYLSSIISPRVCIENPAGIMSTKYRKPDQYINPYQFGEPFAKRTGLWLYGLPKLKPTEILERPEYGWLNQSFDKSGKLRGFNGSFRNPETRSRTFRGIANAMADQWFDFIEKEKKKNDVARSC